MRSDREEQQSRVSVRACGADSTRTDSDVGAESRTLRVLIAT